MPRFSRSARFVCWTAALFIIFGAPWPGWRTAQCEYLLRVAEAVFPRHGAQLDLDFQIIQPPESTEKQARIVIVDRSRMTPAGAGPVRNLDIDLGGLGVSAFGLLLSLCIATPVLWRRRLVAAICGVALLHVAILLFLYFCIRAEASELAANGYSAALRAVAHRLETDFDGIITVSVPVLIWLLTMFGQRALIRRRPVRAAGDSRKDKPPAQRPGPGPAFPFTGALSGLVLAAIALSFGSFLPATSFAEDAPPLPPNLARCFQPPAKFQNDFGNYRSPLRFDDGTPVVTPADWQRRRAEIRNDWDQILGKWPPLVAKPSVTILSSTDRENFTQEKVSVQVAARQTLDGYLLVPKGALKSPAILVTGVDPETSIGLHVPLRDFALQLARRGYVTLAIGAPGGNPRVPQITDANCEPLSFLAYIAANCANALANMPEVDPARIGIVGHAYGGKWALFASCLCDRFACAVWSEAGIVFDERKPNVDYYNPWYLGAPNGTRVDRPERLPETIVNRGGAYLTLYNRRMDLTDLEALMAPRPFLVSAGSMRTYGAFFESADTEARWSALNNIVAVDKLLGYTDRVGMTNRSKHEPTLASNEQIYSFFDHFLNVARKPTVSAAR